jgi:hypothetical protein
MVWVSFWSTSNTDPALLYHRKWVGAHSSNARSQLIPTLHDLYLLGHSSSPNLKQTLVHIESFPFQCSRQENCPTTAFIAFEIEGRRM